MRWFCKTILAAFVALTLGAYAHAQSTQSATVRVENTWARATPTLAKTGAAYVTIINNGSSADRLLGAETPVAQSVEFHEEAEENGISRMRQLNTLEIKPGAKVIFKPGSMHMMMTGLKHPLKQAENFPLTLQFEKAGKIVVAVSVAKVGALQHDDMGSISHETNISSTK